MTAQDVKRMIDNYNIGETLRAWTKRDNLVIFENDYISVCRVDSSNKWVGVNEMEKMWSIIFYLKKDFTMLPNYVELAKILNISVTPVTRGKLEGCYGIRIREMKQEPDRDIVLTILNYIFAN